MSWHRQLPVRDNEIDRGNLHFEGFTVENVRFDCCGVSESKEHRSTFADCTFRNLRFHRSSMGCPVFERCKFENLWASDGHSAHGALFLECKCSGTIKGVNFGFSSMGGLHPEFMIEENVRRARSAPFCIDLSDANCASLGFEPSLLVEKVRFRERQCVILSADNLNQKATALFHTSKDRRLQLLLVNCMSGPPCQRALSLVEQDSQEQLPSYIQSIISAGIEVRTSPLC